MLASQPKVQVGMAVQEAGEDTLSVLDGGERFAAQDAAAQFATVWQRRAHRGFRIGGATYATTDAAATAATAARTTAAKSTADARPTLQFRAATRTLKLRLPGGRLRHKRAGS